MSIIFKNLKQREWFYLFLTLFFTITQVNLDLKVPDYMSEITKLVQTEGSQMNEIYTAGFYMLCCSIGGLILTFAIGFFAARVAATVAMRLRNEIYSKTLSFSLADMDNFSTGSLITRSTNDITQIQNFISMGYIVLLRAPLMAILAISKISSQNTTFTIATSVAVVALITVIAILISLVLPRAKLIQDLIDKLNTVAREHLSGVRVVRAYNAEKYQEDKFEKVNNNVMSNNLFMNRATAFMFPYINFLMSGLTLTFYFLGASLINEAVGVDKLNIFSDMVVFSSYGMQIIMAFMMLTFVFMMLSRVLVSVGRIKEVLDYNNAIVDGTKTSGIENAPYSIEFKNVEFSYFSSEEPVLKDLNFKISKGETVAIIGATGSGKTSIANLLLRFYDCTKGEILVDGVNVKEYTQNALREKMGLVTQKATLFSGTISSNIAYGLDDVSDTLLDKSITIAQAKDFVGKIGTDGKVSQGGLNLSGGQKQRVSISRAIYKEPEIYIFDDCFSALDYKTDKILRAALLDETANTTKVMVAQRISTVKDADQIIVLDDGAIAGIGKHRELLESCSVYKEIASSQLSQEELNYA